MLNFFRHKLGSFTPENILQQILDAAPQTTSMAPNDCRGIYGLVDHMGALRYIDSTSSASETFYKRTRQRHRTGSKTTSQYFSRIYHTDRMWRLALHRTKSELQIKLAGVVSSKSLQCLLKELPVLFPERVRKAVQ